MLKNHLQICLIEPEIPQNTGSIARLAAATGCRLCLIEPLGFVTEDKQLMRPGLDYWPYLDLEIHPNFEKLIQRHQGKMAFFSKKANKCYTEVPIDTELIVFGKETKGLSDYYLETFKSSCYQIPIYHDSVRSLNLANAVSIVVYDQLRQKNKF